MNAALRERLRDARALAAELAGGAGASGPLARAAAAMAGACLEQAAAAPGWLGSHDLVRDQGIKTLREGLVRETVNALLLARAAFERLVVHSHDSKAAEQMHASLAGLANELARLCGGLDHCELKLRERIAEPAAAAIDLQGRKVALRASPDLRTQQLAELVREVDDLKTKREKEDFAVQALRREEQTQREARRALQKEDERLQAYLETLRQEIERWKRKTEDLKQQAYDLEQDRTRIGAHLAIVRGELESLGEDPRDRVRAAVAAALRLLPSDALDKAIGGDR